MAAAELDEDFECWFAAEFENDGKSRIRRTADRAKAKRHKTLIAVLENPGNLMNVGAVIRSIDALGVAKLYVVCPPESKCQVPNWPGSRRSKALATASVSASKWVYMRVFRSTAECFDHLEANGFTSVVTSPHNKGGQPATQMHNASFTQSKLAIWFGNESQGITDEAVERANDCIRLDMAGYVESLNLSVCAGIVLTEAVRQRHAFCEKKRQRRSVRLAQK